VVSVTPFLWFNDNAEEALAHYADVFANSDIVDVTRMDVASMPNGVFTVGTIRIEDLTITVMNGGPAFTLNEAFSLVVSCEGQDEVDYYWRALVDGGAPSQCGWLKDRFGMSWQIVPTLLPKLLNDPDPKRAGRVRDAMLTMGKIECAALRAAYDG
jgi:predicted 3-demethylubiquinone-9 3-methyltransferase (glyoxalase superfamily)